MKSFITYKGLKTVIPKGWAEANPKRTSQYEVSPCTGSPAFFWLSRRTHWTLAHGLSGREQLSYRRYIGVPPPWNITFKTLLHVIFLHLCIFSLALGFNCRFDVLFRKRWVSAILLVLQLRPNENGERPDDNLIVKNGELPSDNPLITVLGFVGVAWP